MIFRVSVSRRRLLSIILLIIATGLILFGSIDLWHRYRATHQEQATIRHTPITDSTDTPSETRPTAACTEYKTSPTHPRFISLPTIGASGCLEQVGIDQHGAIAVPDNIYTAAWYTKSVLPGQPGLSIIDGHISGRYNTDGIFEHLGQLKSGDAVMVTLGSGAVYTYRVYKVQSVVLAQAVGVLLSHDTGVDSQLNLITCGGTYNQTTKLYDHRIIVSAALQ